MPQTPQTRPACKRCNGEMAKALVAKVSSEQLAHAFTHTASERDRLQAALKELLMALPIYSADAKIASAHRRAKDALLEIEREQRGESDTPQARAAAGPMPLPTKRVS